MNKNVSRAFCFTLGLVTGVALSVSVSFKSSDTRTAPVETPQVTKEVTSYIKFEDRLEESLHENNRSEFENIPMSEDLKSYVRKVCDHYDFEESLIYQMIYVESRFQKDVDNGLCSGLMQINKKYADHYASFDDGLFDIGDNYDLNDPYINITLGVRILDDWRRMTVSKGYTRTYDYLCFYNMGWSYMYSGSNGYAETVLSTNLDLVDFSSYTLVK